VNTSVSFDHFKTSIVEKISKPVISNHVQAPGNTSSTFTYIDLINWIYWVGVGLMVCRFLIQIGSLYFITSRAHKVNIDEISLYDMSHSKSNPFSFLKRIYIDLSLYSPGDLKKIIAHETVHVRQFHTADIFLAELLSIFFWYNPFCWVLRKYLKQNLEFLADNAVAAMTDKKDYQYTLLKVASSSSKFILISNFNFNHLKKRIFMLNRKNSPPIMILKYYFLCPVMVLAIIVLSGFNKPFNKLNAAVINAIQPSSKTKEKRFKPGIWMTENSAVVARNGERMIINNTNSSDLLFIVEGQILSENKIPDINPNNYDFIGTRSLTDDEKMALHTSKTRLIYFYKEEITGLHVMNDRSILTTKEGVRYNYMIPYDYSATPVTDTIPPKAKMASAISNLFDNNISYIVERVKNVNSEYKNNLDNEGEVIQGINPLLIINTTLITTAELRDKAISKKKKAIIESKYASFISKNNARALEKYGEKAKDGVIIFEEAALNFK
jgi:beta-lactamase regulating signal transducer with metallopeptidase domain